MSQRQQFLNNHLARVPVTPNQQGSHEMRDEVLSSVGAQEGLDTSGYQVSADLDNVEFSPEKNTTRQIFKQNFFNASDFDLKILQLVRF